jgi:hypothetical protein
MEKHKYLNNDTALHVANALMKVVRSKAIPNFNKILSEFLYCYEDSTDPNKLYLTGVDRFCNQFELIKRFQCDPAKLKSFENDLKTFAIQPLSTFEFNLYIINKYHLRYN